MLILTLALATVGCQRAEIGHFGDGAFYHSRGHYRIRYAPDGERLLPSQWTLTSYAHDSDGRPTEAVPDAHGYDALDTAWLAGRGRSRMIEVPKVDLHFRDDSSRSEIWVRTMVIPRDWDSAPVEAVMHTAVAAISDGSIPMDPLGRRFAPSSTMIRNYGAAEVDGRRAHWVELDVMRGRVVQRVTLVGMRPGDHQWQWRRRHRYPMMLVFGFSSPAEEHESVRRDFAQMVRRVDIGG